MPNFPLLHVCRSPSLGAFSISETCEGGCYIEAECNLVLKLNLSLEVKCTVMRRSYGPQILPKYFSAALSRIRESGNLFDTGT